MSLINNLLLVFLLQIVSFNCFSKEDIECNKLDEQWLIELLKTTPSKDFRSDSDQLRPLINYDSHIVQVQNYSKKSKMFMSGEGCQLVGSEIDSIENDVSKFVLYGRDFQMFKAGFWNNSLDKKNSYKDFVVIEFRSDEVKILVKKKIKSKESQIFLGLRRQANSKGFDVIQNSGASNQIVIWSYYFQ